MCPSCGSRVREVCGEAGEGVCVSLGRGMDRVLSEVPPAFGSLLGLASGVSSSRESSPLVPYQRVCVYLWGASGGEGASLAWGSQPTSLLLSCPAVLTASQIIVRPQG